MTIKTLAAWATVVALWTPPAMATTLSMVGVPATLQPGESFTLSVNVTDAVDLYAFQFDLGFDPSVLQVSEVLDGGFLSSAGGSASFVPGTLDNLAGAVRFTAGTLLGAGPGVGGDGVLARLVFEAVGEGRSALSFTDALLLDAALDGVDATLRGTEVVVGTAHVPEPGPAGLVVLALALARLATGRARRAGPTCRGLPSAA